MKFIRKNIKIITSILIVILIICLIGLKIYLNNNIQEEIVEDKKEVDNVDLLKEEVVIDEDVKKIVFVDIKGEIVNPGVYEIESNKKVIDVINLAGGLTDRADTSLINLAKQVANEMVVIIYSKEEVELAKKEEPIVKIIEKECICPEVKNDACLDKVKDDKIEGIGSKIVNLNKASLEELLTLDGIGESKAKAIISYREEHNGFSKIEELLEVNGIGESLYEKVKENITV